MPDRYLRSFPTRRSSDLAVNAGYGANADPVSASTGTRFFVTDARGTKKRVPVDAEDRKSTRLNSSHLGSSYAVFCLKKKSYCCAMPADAADAASEQFERR